MSLTNIDRDLIQACLTRQPGAWNDFVDRFLSLVYHVIQHTVHLRSARLSPEDIEDIAAEVLLQIVAEDYRVLRQFKGQANLSTYLTVIARRICIHELNRRQTVKDTTSKAEIAMGEAQSEAHDDSTAAQRSVESLEEVERLLRKLSGKDREIVRLFYLEGRTYEEISTELDVPLNTIGGKLSRARAKLREMSGVTRTDIPRLPSKPSLPDPRPTTEVRTPHAAP